MKATIIGHQGWADFFSLKGLYNHCAAFYSEVTIFTLDEARRKMMQAVFQDKSNVKIEVPEFISYSPGETCLVCHTYGGSSCPRAGGKCQYIDYSKYPDYIHIKSGGFNNYGKWESHVRNSSSFAHAFYTYAGLDPQDRIDRFNVSRNTINDVYNLSNLRSQIGEDYIVTHNDNVRGYTFNLDSKGLPIYDLNLKSETLIDQLAIIENAQELHFIDSSYSVLIYLMSFHNLKIAQIPKYLHKACRPSNRDVAIYKNPTPPNWYVI